MPKTFLKFDEVEKEVSIKAPKTVFKYRDWKDENHQRLLTHQELWFAHPFGLNDPLDVRPDIKFDDAELNDPAYLRKMIASANMNTDRDNIVRAENQLDLIRENPQMMLDHQKAFNADESNFDVFGVFSTAMGELNDHLWQEYSKDHSGYCIGFNTVELCRHVKSGFGFVTYGDEPFIYHFLNKRDDDPDMFYYKKEKWWVEDEFRFITVGIGRYSGRVQTFRTEIVTEIILGYNMIPDHENTIVELCEKYYPGVAIYKTKRNAAAQLEKHRII